MKMTFKVGGVYRVNTKTINEFMGILVSKKGAKLTFKTIGYESFNESIYCLKDDIVTLEGIPKNRLYYYLNSSDPTLISEIFNSLKN
jgi:hypothetical protein